MSVSTPNTPILSQDTTRTITGSSTKVYASAGGETIITNILTPIDDQVTGIINMANAEINLSVWFPSSAQILGGSLSMFLISQDGATVPLNIPQIIPDQWQAIHFDMPRELQSGRYQFGIIYTGSSPATYWVDGISITERVVTWEARANPTDPWVEFRDIVNSDSSGVVLNKGTALQVQGTALQQDSVIMSSPKIVPVYAQLGKFLWPEDEAANPNPYSTTIATTTGALAQGTAVTSVAISPFQYNALLSSYYSTAPSHNFLTIYSGNNQQTFTISGAMAANATSITTGFTPNFAYPVGSTIQILGAPWTYSVGSNRTYTFTSGFTGNTIIDAIWEFSDGAVLNGSSVVHQFPTTAATNSVYNVTLINVDLYGGRSSVTQTLTVS